MQRGYKECVEIDHLRETDRIEVHFYKEGFVLHKDSSSTDIARWDMGILSAKMYVGSMRDNVIRSMNYNWSKGKWQGLSPLGYLNARDSDNKATVVLDPVRAPLVKRLFEEYATGRHSLQTLEALAKEISLFSKRVRKDRTINRNDIWGMLSNPFYYGVMRIKGKLIPHIYEPIIDKALFDKCQDVLTGNSRTSLKLGYAGIPFIFRGLIRCGTCGGAITSERHVSKTGNTHVYLKCNHKNGPCNQEVVKEDVLLDQLDREIFDRAHMPKKELEKIKAGVKDFIKNESNAVVAAKKNIANQMSALKVKEDRLFDLFLDGKITEPLYESKKADIEREREEIRAISDQYAELGNDLPKILEDIVEIAGNVGNAWNRSIISEKREILTLLLSNGVLSGQRLGYTLPRPIADMWESADCSIWSGILSDYRMNNLTDFITLSKKIQTFKDNMKTIQNDRPVAPVYEPIIRILRRSRKKIQA